MRKTDILSKKTDEKEAQICNNELIVIGESPPKYTIEQ